MPKRETIYFDVTENLLRNSCGDLIGIRDWPEIYYKDEDVVLCIYLVRGDALLPFTELTAAMTFTASVDYDFSNTSNRMVSTADSGFNVAGDWISDGNADVTTGQLSIQIDADTTRFGDAMENKGSRFDTRLEIRVYNDDSNPKQRNVFRMPIICRNLQDAS